YLHLFSSDDLVSLDHSDDKSCQIIFAFGIKARHLGSFTPDQGTAVVLAGGREAFDYFLCNLRLECARGKVIHKEQWGRALYGNVVYAVIDEVSAYRRVQLHGKGHL